MRLLLLFQLCTLCAVSAVAERPNIVYILADDLGYGDVACLNPGRGKIPTPHLDKLASQGMTFTDAHSGSSVCTPTRYGVLTGRYAWRTRLQKGVLDGGNDEPLIAADRLTVAGFLRQQGYSTACIGKWHLGFQSDMKTAKGSGKGAFGSGGLPVGARLIGAPTTRGFDEFWGCSNARTMASWIEGDRVIESVPPIEILPRLGQRAVGHIQERAADAKAGRPFFLYLPLTAPHTPILPTPEWQGKSGLGDYGDFVMMTDAIVGEVLAALDDADLTRDTLVIFTADNGCSPQAGTAELEARGHYASGPFRGYKADIWEGGHRVPFLVRWPGRVSAGSQSHQLVCLTDLMATCAEIIGVDLLETAAEDSVSLLPELLGKAGGSSRQSVVHHSISGRFAIRQGSWKLNVCAGSGGWARPSDNEALKRGMPMLQLYDMDSDPGETRNLAEEQPGRAAQMRAQLETIIAQGRSTPGTRQKNDVSVSLDDAATK